MRGRFVRRIGLLGAALLVLMSATLVLLALVAAGALRVIEPRGVTLWVVALVAILLGSGVWAAAHALRTAAHPAADLIEATAALAEGDYTVRVPERGPREARRLARSFNRMADRVEEQDRQRRDLLADVTHELRTPLTVIQANIEALIDGIHPRDEEHLQGVLEEARVLAGLVEDLRTLALAEAGALPLHREPTDLDLLAREAVAAFQPQADAAGATLTTESAPHLPPVDVDPRRVRQVLGILITNAVQHIGEGGTVHVESAPSARDPSAVEVVVRDTGPGIAAADLPHVFERFYKSPDSRGSGLGLAIARNLITALGGEMWAESAPGMGTTVRFTLAIAAEM